MRSVRRITLSLSSLSLLSALAYASAGGGGHYGGGGGFSSGSHGGSGSGGGDFAYFIIRIYIELLIRYPYVVLPVTGVALYLAYVVHRESDVMFVSDGRMGEVISKASQIQDLMSMRTNLGELQSRDPDFDPDAFLRRAAAAFVRVQQAWSDQDMSPGRAFISDGVMERFSIQLDLDRAQKMRNVVEQVQVQEATLVEMEKGDQFDTLHVRLSASALDRDVSLDDGHILCGSASEPRNFVEIWSFLRRPGAKTLKKPGLIEGNCPNCGAPLPIADAAQCGVCKSWVNSGQFDWVLSEITQECEWKVKGDGRAVSGFAELARRDPGLNLQFLEDRVSVAFWRWQLALAGGSSAPLRSVALGDYCRSLDEELKATPWPLSQNDLAVGAVRILAVEPGSPGDFDRVHAAVRWSVEESGVRQHVFVLSRKASALTDPRTGLSSLRCSGCGAPATSRDAVNCQYCGASFNDGTKQWAVSAVVAIGFWKPPPPPAAAVAPDSDGDKLVLDLDWTAALSPAETLAVLISAMLADGKIDPQERAYLEAYARKQSVDPQSLERMIGAVRDGEIRPPQPKTADEAQVCLKGMLEMSLADGTISEAEMALMIAFGRGCSMSEDQVRAFVQKEKIALYRRAKKTIRIAPTGGLTLDDMVGGGVSRAPRPLVP